MIYLDTSVAVSLFTPETTSQAVFRWMEDCNSSLIATDWLVTEFASALAIKNRLGSLTKAELKATQKEFDAFLASGLRLTAVTRSMFSLAAELAGRSENHLRAGDALHLAAAITLNVRSMATLDQSLAKMSEKCGLKNVKIH